jgi:hypothetical protein
MIIIVGKAIPALRFFLLLRLFMRFPFWRWVLSAYGPSGTCADVR